ncbi:molybdopterin cofactor-binding domain-containing protein [Eoetvoesiella caeni]
MSYIGQRVRAIDWNAKTTGGSLYAGDLVFDGLLVARVLRSPYSHARIVSIDTRKAHGMPGVHGVITIDAFPPGARYIHEGARDRPPLADGVVRYVGEEVAAVAAETLEQAEAALQTIVVRYDVRVDTPLSAKEALEGGGVSLHERTTGKRNVSFELKRTWGNFEEGLEAGTISVAGHYYYPQVNHACMEPNIAIAQWSETEQKLELWTSTQSPYYISLEVAEVLGLRPEQVVCREVAVGGGFGAKSKIAEHEGIAAMLAKVTRRPVKLALSRTEEFAYTKTRHAFSIDLDLHADTQGRLHAIHSDVVVSNGAYNHSGVSVVSAGLKAYGMMYRPKGIRARARLVDSAMIPGGQFRGYGSTQTGFALECLLDELAEKLHCDPLELRLRNANQAGDTTLIGAKLGSVKLTQCLEAVRDAIGWDHEKAAHVHGRGVGVAAAVHPSGAYAFEGSNRSDCAIDIFADGAICLRFGGADAGTGQRTILAQIAAHELGVALGDVQVLTMDSEQTPYDQGAWSSRGTHYSGHAARLTCKTMAEEIQRMAQRQWGDAEVWLEGGFVCSAERRIALAQLISESARFTDGVYTVECSYHEKEVVRPDPKTGLGNHAASYNFAAHAAVVNVDPKVGSVEVLDYVAAHDVGVAINPTFVEGQMAGGVVMGLGAALGEEIIQEQGKVVNASYMHYALPRAADVPRIRTILVEGYDEHGPYGAKGTGELGVNPPASVISNAVYDAIGVRVRELPITPDKILNALAQKNGHTRAFGIWRRPGRWWVALVRAAYPMGLLQWLHRRQQLLVNAPSVPESVPVDMPLKLDDALSLLDRHQIPIAGGTDVQPSRRQGLIRPVRLVSLHAIREMAQIVVDNSGMLRVGAGVTLSDLYRAVAEDYPVLAQAIQTIAGPQIREMATLGGNLLQGKRCWFYRNAFPCYKRKGGLAPCYAIEGDHRFYHAVIDGHRCQAVTPSDLATALIALDAKVAVRGASGTRVVDVASLYRGPGESVLQSDELLTEIHIPPLDGRRAAFKKLSLWEGDFALVSVALSAQISVDGIWSKVRICCGGVGPVPWRAWNTESRLEGRAVNAELMRHELDLELNAVAHPLRRNGWKLDATAGLAERLVEQLNSDPHAKK